MELKTWLNAERGRASALAQHLGVSQGRITQMADEGVPTKHMRKVRDFTKQIVTLESMVAAKERQAAAIQPFPQASHG
ncbi:hypothetical protein IB233_02160 [Comamonas sp. CMM01]|uniref:hypothetical protein n=1 Tax=Comamonas sp. CMM01 TaxID=2769280 RepID=UPI00177AF015|nr:hypothetical protein [Comamonas sp. CMM01]MBD9530436.1 hypothetical protein [Comamonas sp. CMM01]